MKKGEITVIIGFNWGDVMIKAVLFDLDGTLINSLDDLADSVNYALAELGYPTHETEKYKYFVGNGMKNLIKRATPEGADRQKVYELFMDRYHSHSLEKTAPYDDIITLLSALRDRGIKAAVVTNKAEANARAISAHFFGSSLLVFGQREGIPTKPDPTLTLIAMKELGVKPQECLFVGDSGMDMAVGVNSGAKPVGVTWGFRKREELLENGAKHLIDKPLELLELIK